MNSWQYIEKDKDNKKAGGSSRLKEVRISLGMTITALSKTADVSTKVISQTERMLTKPTKVTKNKILKGLNAGRSSDEKKWKYKEIFPEDDE